VAVPNFGAPAGWLYYDVAGGSAYGPKKAAQQGAQYERKPTALVENMWRECEPHGGPVMLRWDVPPLYSDGITPALPHFVKVKSPTGGDQIKIGTQVKVQFYTAGLQGQEVCVYWYQQTPEGPVGPPPWTLTIAAAANEAANYSKVTEVIWNTTGLSPGTYAIRAVLKGYDSNPRYVAESGNFTLHN
jgi:hypothetical protein